MNETDPTTLLAEAQDGSQSAFAALETAFGPGLRRFVRRLLGRGDLTDDIVQNTFFALYVNLESMDAQRLRPFLFRVARNQCYDELRRQGRYEVVALADEDDSEPGSELTVTPTDTAIQPDEAAHWLLLYAQVQQAINRLPELQRQTLLLFTEGGLSHAEIAESMDVSTGTVKSRLHYAKRSLTAMLSAETLLELEGG